MEQKSRRVGVDESARKVSMASGNEERTRKFSKNSGIEEGPRSRKTSRISGTEDNARIRKFSKNSGTEDNVIRSRKTSRTSGLEDAPRSRKTSGMDWDGPVSRKSSRASGGLEERIRKISKSSDLEERLQKISRTSGMEDAPRSRKISAMDWDGPVIRKTSRTSGGLEERIRKISKFDDLEERLRKISKDSSSIGYSSQKGRPSIVNEDESSQKNSVLRRPSIAVIFISKKTPQIMAAFAATVGAFSMGAVEGWTSPALPKVEESGKLGELTTDEYSNIASFALITALLSGVPTGLLIQKLGRKSTMLGLTVPFVLGWLLVAFSSNVNMMYVGRLITGFCAGACSLAVPIYIGETAEDSIRGMLGSGFQLMATCGNLFVYIVGTFVSWQWLAIICACIPVIGLIVMILVPPSPRYLLSRGRVPEASDALVWLRGAVSTQQVELELAMTQNSIDSSRAEKASMKDLIKPEILKPIAVSMGLMFFQQASGIEAVLMYTVDIFKAGDSKIDSNLSTILLGVCQVVATILATLLVDRLGRRILLLVSDVLMAIAMIVLGVFFYLKHHNPSVSENLSWLPLVALLAFIIAYSLGFGPIAWMMAPELIPNKAIGPGSAVCTTFNWSLSFLNAKFFHPLVEMVGYEWVFAGYACCCILGSFFVFFLVPETNGKSLDEIQEYFNGSAKKSRDKSQTKV